MGCVELGAAAAMDPRLMGLNLPVLGIFRGTGVPMGVSGWYPKVPPLWLQGGSTLATPILSSPSLMASLLPLHHTNTHAGPWGASLRFRFLFLSLC